MSQIKTLLLLIQFAIVLTGISCDDPGKEDNPPMITKFQPEQLQLTTNINDTITFSITAVDEDGDAVNYKFLKDNIEVSGNNGYTWEVDKKGATIIKGVAYNDLADTVKWIIEVENRAPVVVDTSFSMLEEAVVSISKSKLAYDPDNDEIIFELLENENVDAAFNDSLIITGLSDYFGNADVKYEVSDGAASDTGNISIQVENVNDRPTSIVDNLESTIDSPIDLDGSQSYHPDSPINEITNYNWEQLSGPDVEINDGNSNIANFTPLTKGEYKFILTVQDNLSQEDKDTLTAVIESYLLTVNTKDVLNDENIDNLEVIFAGKSSLTENGVAEIELPTMPINVNIDTLFIKDDVTSEIGDYFDYKEKIYLVNNYEKNVLMIPNLDMEGAYYGNILNLIKSMTRTRGTAEDGGNTTLKRWDEIPIALFYNRANAPDGYTDALIQAIGDTENDTLEGWENKTGFLYKGQELEPLDLFHEVSSDPGVGLAMDYNGNFSHVVIDENYSDGTPKHGVVYINNNIGHPLNQLMANRHEFGHALRYGRGIESDDPVHVMNRGSRIAFEEGAAVKVMCKLPNKQDMGYYLED